MDRPEPLSRAERERIIQEQRESETPDLRQLRIARGEPVVTIDQSQFEAFINDLKGVPSNINLSSCIFQLQQQMMEHLEVLGCENGQANNGHTDDASAQSGGFLGSNCQTSFTEELMPLAQALQAAHGTQVTEAGHFLPPFVPGENNSPQLNATDAQEVAAGLVHDCGRSAPYSATYMSNEVLTALEGAIDPSNHECLDDLSEFMSTLLNSHAINDRFACKDHPSECRQHDLAVANTLQRFHDIGLVNIPEVRDNLAIQICADDPGDLNDPLSLLLQAAPGITGCTPL